MNESAIKTILDKNNVSDSENLSRALAEILSKLPKESSFTRDLIESQNKESRRNDRIHGIR